MLHQGGTVGIYTYTHPLPKLHVRIKTPYLSCKVPGVEVDGSGSWIGRGDRPS